MVLIVSLRENVQVTKNRVSNYIKGIQFSQIVQITNVVTINAVKSLEQDITVAINFLEEKILNLQEIQMAMGHMLHQ